MSAWEAPSQSDDWITPKYIFDALGVTFDLDVAAPPCGTHVPRQNYIDQDSLRTPWWGCIWMNPPFGARNGILPWLEKFVQHGNGIALTPDRTSAPWFQWASRRMDMILFVSPKVKFERPDGSIGKSPGCGTALMAMGPKACDALISARAAGLGMIMRPER